MTSPTASREGIVGHHIGGKSTPSIAAHLDSRIFRAVMNIEGVYFDKPVAPPRIPHMRQARQAPAQQAQVSVLALDIVSYSRELDETQQRLVSMLNDVLTACIKSSGHSHLFRLPTGDGAILVFPGQPSSVALDLAIAIHVRISENLTRLPLRMGLHNGLAAVSRDSTGQATIVGSALNICVRIMNLGDDGHILVSDNVFNDLKNQERFASYLSPLASNPIEVKHGVALDVFTYTDSLVGNPTEPRLLVDNVGLRSCKIGRPPDQWPLFTTTSHTLKIVDHSGPFFGIPQLLDRLLDLVCRRDVVVQVLLLNPLSVACQLRSMASAYKSIDELENTIGYTFRLLRHLRKAIEPHGKHALARYDVRLFDAVPTFGGFITDEFAYISTYVEHLSGSRGPYFVYARQKRQHATGNSLYGCFTKSFDILWLQRSISIFARDFKKRQAQVLAANRHMVRSTSVTKLN